VKLVYRGGGLTPPPPGFVFCFCSPWPLGLGFLFPLVRFPVVAVVSKPLGLLEFLPPSVVLVEAVVFLSFVFALSLLVQAKALWFLARGERRVLEVLLVEMLFKARSINLGWLSFDKNLPVAVFGPLRSRWSPGGTV
jgi:hypothetical protein